ncbi:1-acylglycerol-3-phosphate O-acyltransferase protein [Dioscorea alata]|uniref:1-acylglycerol-3-phosphate O-acyltransferase protein n=3 Tax=Dioscorea alata TaxID=55571 RepID=A0ACB7WN05_DIOAL|nr:1-acylglycerol-3-phosphate O-acyltransferase protein [Dioscorea alata]KAH7689733.1 1-acylglycerol-3-phosphate O-acyltransferase protein [Dioscorea alata]KAH7689734.1 1-acylglycerol-3-phosphate O-acyltransferase protein [Dioscorea alata]
MNGSTNSRGMSSNGIKEQEEATLALNSNDEPRHSPLTLIRALRGILCLVTLLSTAFMLLIYLAPITTLIVRMFSVHYSRKATSFLFGIWLSLWPFLFEKINGTKVVFSGDMIPSEERILLLANHRTEVDWMYLWDLALRKGFLGHIKYILKKSLMKLPIFGWGFQIFEFISVERKWESDELIMKKKLSAFKDPKDPLWLALFPEGTDYTEQKCLKSQQFAAENNLPILKNVLIPKTKGFYACLESLRNTLNAVYDVTIAYKHRCPTFIDNVFGVDPSEVHIHVKRISLNEIPTSEEEAAAWLIERFHLKDHLLSDFAALGYFPHQVPEENLSILVCLVKFLLVIVTTSLFTHLTLFSSVWYKVYVAFSFTYLTAVTYFDILPSPVLCSSVKSLFCSKKMS